MSLANPAHGMSQLSQDHHLALHLHSLRVPPGVLVSKATVGLFHLCLHWCGSQKPCL